MRPVVVNPGITSTQLVAELSEVETDEKRTLARDQFLAKLQRKKAAPERVGSAELRDLYQQPD